MIPRDARLYIYEAPADLDVGENAPGSYVGLWDEEGFSYLFFTEPQDTFVQSVLPKGATWTRHEMSYGDWQSMGSVPGFAIGNSAAFFVYEDHPDPPEGAIVLDPSVVFGDGSHPTTLACLEIMAEMIGSREIGSMLDLGAGAGTLGLAAVKLGVSRVVAVEKTEIAFKTIVKNIRLNTMEKSISAYRGDARHFMDEPFDLVCANLPFSVLRDLAPMRQTTNHGLWIVSGVNNSQAQVLKELFMEQRFAIIETGISDKWVTFVAENRCS
jgi:ribosomal protein L11 methyltransferase